MDVQMEMNASLNAYKILPLEVPKNFPQKEKEEDLIFNLFYSLDVPKLYVKWKQGELNIDILGVPNRVF